MLRLSIVIVNYNSGAHLAQCLAAIDERPYRESFEVVVVDNHSTDGSTEGDRNGRAHVISLPENVGFARAANTGIASSRGEMVLVLNPDVMMADGTLETMVRALESDPRLGVVGPRIRETSAEPGQVSLQPFPTNRRQLREALFLDRLLGRGSPERGWLRGCCLLFRRRALEEVGNFDPDFFLYYEDVDLFYRFQASAWRAAIDPRSEVIHESGERDSRYGEAKLRWYHRSLLEFYRKHYPRKALRSLRRILILRSVIRIGLWASLYLIAPARREERGERVRGYAAVLRSLWNGSSSGSDGRFPI